MRQRSTRAKGVPSDDDSGEGHQNLRSWAESPVKRKNIKDTKEAAEGPIKAVAKEDAVSYCFSGADDACMSNAFPPLVGQAIQLLQDKDRINHCPYWWLPVPCVGRPCPSHAAGSSASG
jgi:hypothetical protein